MNNFLKLAYEAGVYAALTTKVARPGFKVRDPDYDAPDPLRVSGGVSGFRDPRYAKKPSAVIYGVEPNSTMSLPWNWGVNAIPKATYDEKGRIANSWFGDDSIIKGLLPKTNRRREKEREESRGKQYRKLNTPPKNTEPTRNNKTTTTPSKSVALKAPVKEVKKEGSWEPNTKVAFLEGLGEAYDNFSSSLGNAYDDAVEYASRRIGDLDDYFNNPIALGIPNPFGHKDEFGNLLRMTKGVRGGVSPYHRGHTLTEDSLPVPGYKIGDKVPDRWSQSSLFNYWVPRMHYRDAARAMARGGQGPVFRPQGPLAKDSELIHTRVRYGLDVDGKPLLNKIGPPLT